MKWLYEKIRRLLSVVIRTTKRASGKNAAVRVTLEPLAAWKQNCWTFEKQERLYAQLGTLLPGEKPLPPKLKGEPHAELKYDIYSDVEGHKRVYHARSRN